MTYTNWTTITEIRTAWSLITETLTAWIGSRGRTAYGSHVHYSDRVHYGGANTVTKVRTAWGEP